MVGPESAAGGAGPRALVRTRGMGVVYMPHTPFRTVALDGVSVSIEEGDLLGIVGATGSGKSTFVQALAGLLDSVSGEVDYREDFPLDRLYSKIGLVFQMPEDQLFERTVFEDVGFGPRQLGWASARVEEAVRRALAAVELPFEQFAHRAPLGLSGGEKRRVAIAGILAMEPALLVMDEPAAGLDGRGTRALESTLRRLHGAGTTIALVSHDLDLLARVATRVVVFSGGRVIADGPIAGTLADPDVMGRAGLEATFSARLLDELARRGWPVARGCMGVAQVAEAIEGARPTARRGR